MIRRATLNGLLRTAFAFALLTPSLLTGQVEELDAADFLPHDAILLPTPWSPWFIGPYGGPDYTVHRGDFELYEDGILCCRFDNGEGLGYTAGVKTFLPLAEKTYLSPRVAYTRHNGTFTEVSEEYPFRGLNDSVELMTFTEELETPIPAFAADLIFAYQLDSATGFYLGAGPSVEYLIETQFTKSEQITGPNGLTFLDGTVDRFQEIDFAPDANTFVIGGRLGAGMLYPLTESIRVNPELLVSLPVSVVSGQWRMFEVQLTVGVLFGVGD